MSRIEKSECRPNVAKSQRRPVDNSVENNGAIMKLSLWKNNMIEKLIKDDDLTKLLYYNSEDALFKDNLTKEQRESLVNSRIKGYRYIPEVVKEASSYISMSVANFVPQEGFRQFSDDYVMGYLTFYILVDVSLMDTETGYRNDLIASRIYSMFQNSRDFGIGELRLETMLELWTQNNKFGGYTMGFRIVDFK